MWPSAWDASNEPTQESPEIDQEQGEAEHKEAKGWIARGGLDAHSAQDSIGRLDAKAGTIALASSTELARTARFTADSACKDGGLFILAQKGNHGTRAEAAVEIEAFDAQPERLQTLVEATYHRDHLVFGQNEGDRQGQAQLAIDDVGTDDAEEVGSPFMSLFSNGELLKLLIHHENSLWTF